MSYLERNISGRTIKLPSHDLPNGKRIYVYDMASDIATSRDISIVLCNEVRCICGPVIPFDFIICAESKGVILGTMMSFILDKPLMVLRKENKTYYDDMVAVTTSTYTTENPKRLYVPEHEIESFAGKRALFVDDVISTGSTSTAIRDLCRNYDIDVVYEAYVFSEGDSERQFNQIYLARIPVENISDKSSETVDK